MTPSSAGRTPTPATARTLLFVPGNRPDRFAKAVAAGADLVVIDLEDAVPPADKASAREAVVEWLRPGSPRVAVRVNAATSPHHEADLAALAGRPGLAAVVLPMADDPTVLSTMYERLGPAVALLPLVETARGLARVTDLATAPGVVRLAFGHLDFAADLDAAPDPEAMLLARSTLVLASRVAGLPGPVDGVTTDLTDLSVTRADAQRARRLGFTGKLCVHPRQVAVVHDAFRPEPDQVAWARRVVAADTGGAGVVDGAMVDAPVVARARAILARAGEEVPNFNYMSARATSADAEGTT